MDRITKIGVSTIGFAMLLGTQAVFGPPCARADVVFAASAGSGHGPGDGDYPESYFGRAPSKPVTVETQRDGYRGPASAPDSPQAGTPVTSNDLIPNARTGVQEVSVIAGDMGFFPKTVFVTKDVPVRMFVTGVSASTLCIMIDPFNVKKQVTSQKVEEITFTPNIPGKYRFYCPVNGGEGTLVVREFAPQQAETRAPAAVSTQ